MTKRGTKQRSGQYFVHNKELAAVLKAESVKAGNWGVFVTYGDTPDTDGSDEPDICDTCKHLYKPE